MVDLSNDNFQNEFAEVTEKQATDLSKKLARRGIDIFKFSTNTDFDKSLREFFQLRKSRRGTR